MCGNLFHKVIKYVKLVEINIIKPFKITNSMCFKLIMHLPDFQNEGVVDCLVILSYSITVMGNWELINVW